MLALAVGAEDRRAPVDRMRVNEPTAAPKAWRTTSAVYGELFDERSTLAARVTVVAKARAAGVDASHENITQLAEQSVDFFGRQRRSHS